MFYSFLSYHVVNSRYYSHQIPSIICYHDDNSTLYKSEIYLTSYLINTTDSPTITLDDFKKYIIHLYNTPFSYNMISDRKTNNFIKVIITLQGIENDSNQQQTRYFNSARKCAIILEKEYEVTISSKTVTSYVSKSKKNSCSVILKRGNYSFIIETNLLLVNFIPFLLLRI